MTKLPAPEQWLLCEMNEMECAEMIERHIDFYKENADGSVRSVHLPMPFVRHYLQRHDNVLPTVVAIATAPIVLADGALLAPEGFDRLRGIIFEIQKEVRAIIPRWEECNAKAVGAAMQFLCDEWLCDVATDYAGKCITIAAALTIIERSLLNTRPAFFVTAGRRGGGKTTLLQMLIMAVTGIMPAAAAWSTNEEERRKALLSYFLYGVAYILWDNIAKGTQISCPHIEKSCTSDYYADRKLGVSEMVATAAASIHFFTGNNIGPRGDLASRSLDIRLVVDRPDPENRVFKHPDPIGWTENHRAELLRALFTILLGNPQLDAPRDAPAKTRFKMWWRLVGSAIEHAARLHAAGNSKRKDITAIDFQNLFIKQEEEDDEESLSLADALAIMQRKWPDGFHAEDVARYINDTVEHDAVALREFLYPVALPNFVAAPRSVGKQLKKHLDEPVKSGEQTLALKRKEDTAGKTKGAQSYCISAKPAA
jgi:hypothetical protein